MPKKWRDQVTLVVQAHEANSYKTRWPNPLLTLPPGTTTINESRQWVLENCHDEYHVMLDDDLRFFARRDDEPTLFRDMDWEDWDQMFKAIHEHLVDHAHVGVLGREGGNRIVEPVVHNTRMMRVLCYHRQTLIDHDIRFDCVELMEDHAVNLQLLTLGYTNAVLCNWVHNQTHGSDAAGGCSVYRTPALQSEAAHRLHELFPNFVTVVQKETKQAWGGGVRDDVRIQWKKAYDTSHR